MGADGARACGGGGECVAARGGGGDASSPPARRGRGDSHCAAATSRFRDSNFQGCDLRPRPPCCPSIPLSDSPTRNCRLLRNQTARFSPAFVSPPFAVELPCSGLFRCGRVSTPTYGNAILEGNFGNMFLTNALSYFCSFEEGSNSFEKCICLYFLRMWRKVVSMSTLTEHS